MKLRTRLALILAAGLLGTACGATSDSVTTPEPPASFNRADESGDPLWDPDGDAAMPAGADSTTVERGGWAGSGH